MPEDYVNGDFRQINVVKALPTYPLQEQDDADHCVYKFRCRVKRADYKATVPQLDSPMTAGASGISGEQMPFTDSNALFVGDVGHTRLPFDRIEFTRRWATIPKDQEERFVGAQSWPFPAYRDYRYTPPVYTTDEVLNTPYDLRRTPTAKAPLYRSVEYFLASGPVPEIPTAFQVTLEGNRVDYVADLVSTIVTASAINPESPEAYPGNLESTSFVEDIAATVPSMTEYLAKVEDGDLLITGVSVEQYMGNIHRLVVDRMKAQ